MQTRLGRTVLLVHDLDAAKDFYARLGFSTLFDQETDGRRFVHVGPPGQPGAGLWLFAAETDEQRALVGRQAAGAPFLVLYTDDLRTAHAELSAGGMEFLGPPQEQEGSRFAHLEDLYGNRLVLVELGAVEGQAR